MDLSNDIRIVGTTLWSHVPSSNASDVACFIADYRRIGGLRIEDTNRMHAEDVAYLEKEISLAEANGVRLVIVTHHAPLLSMTSHEKNRGSTLNCAFATDLSHLVDRPGVAKWIFGHTHFSCDLGKVVSNQRGLTAEESSTFDPMCLCFFKKSTAKTTGSKIAIKKFCIAR
jgi:hypothetical protein